MTDKCPKCGSMVELFLDLGRGTEAAVGLRCTEHPMCLWEDTMADRGARIAELETEAAKEKASRIGYQDVVYAVCNILDAINGRSVRIGKGMVVDEVVSGIQTLQSKIAKLEAIVDKLRAACLEALPVIMEARDAVEEQYGEAVASRQYDHLIGLLSPKEAAEATQEDKP